MSVVRRPAVAGSFYPAGPEALERAVAGFLAEVPPPAPAGAPPKAIIAPHAGYMYSGPVAARAYARLAGARGRVERVVLIGPSHHVAFSGVALDESDAWETPLGTVPIDVEAIQALPPLPQLGRLEAAHAREHALEVQVPFLQHVLGSFRLLPMVTGDASPASVAAVLEATWGGPETLIVVSSDLSHYLDYGACQAIDAATASAIERLEGDAIDRSGACGRVAIRGLLQAARAHGLAAERLDLRNSGDTAGPRDQVVGYGAWAFAPAAGLAIQQDPAIQQDEEAASIARHGPLLVDLARAGIEIGFNTGRPAELRRDARLPDLLRAPGAAFVTLRRDTRLRGCIGSPRAHRPLVLDVLHHAFNAAFLDPRFPPLQLLEMAGLDLSVSVLTPPQPMQFADEQDLIRQLRPHVDGLIIADAGRGALFLPSVWSELADPSRFLAALKHKAGLRADHFSPGFTASHFRAVEVEGHVTGQPNRLLGSDLFAWTPVAGTRTVH